MLEYRHCLLSWHDAVFTNVADPKLFEMLSSFIRISTFFDEAKEQNAPGRPGKRMAPDPGRQAGDKKPRGPAVHKTSLAGLKEFRPEKTVVLDPAAPKALRTGDMERSGAIVVGGILGSEGFTGKTGRLLTDRLGCRARNLGKTQLSIDSSVVVCRLIALGLGLEDIELTSELEILHDDGHSTVLPYGYPVLEGKVIFTPGLKEYLRKH